MERRRESLLENPFYRLDQRVQQLKPDFSPGHQITFHREDGEFGSFGRSDSPDVRYIPSSQEESGQLSQAAATHNWFGRLDNKIVKEANEVLPEILLDGAKEH